MLKNTDSGHCNRFLIFRVYCLYFPIDKHIIPKYDIRIQERIFPNIHICFQGKQRKSMAI